MTRDLSLPFKKEADFTKAALKWLNNQPSTWAVKFHASGYTNYGVPDILCSVNGIFLALELKAEGGKLTPLQEQTIKKIRSSNGLAFTVWSISDVQRMWSVAQSPSKLEIKDWS